MGSNSNYENSQPGMMQQQPQQQQMGGAGVAGAMMPQGGQQGSMMTQGGQERGMMTQPGQQSGMMTQPGQQGGMMGALVISGCACTPALLLCGCCSHASAASATFTQGLMAAMWYCNVCGLESSQNLESKCLMPTGGGYDNNNNNNNQMVPGQQQGMMQPQQGGMMGGMGELWHAPDRTANTADRRKLIGTTCASLPSCCSLVCSDPLEGC